MNKNYEILKGIEFDNLNDESLKKLLVEKFSKNINKSIIPGESYIPVSGKVIDEEDVLWGIESMMDAWLTAGRFSNKLERELARYFGSRFSLLVNSGSSANLLAFYALTSPKLLDRAIKPGDEIITVAAGFPTTINPMIQFGCIPVFVDVEIPKRGANSSPDREGKLCAPDGGKDSRNAKSRNPGRQKSSGTGFS